MKSSYFLLFIKYDCGGFVWNLVDKFLVFLLVPVLKGLSDAVVHYMSSFSVAFATPYKAIYYVTDRPLCVSVYENTGKIISDLYLACSLATWQAFFDSAESSKGMTSKCYFAVEGSWLDPWVWVSMRVVRLLSQLVSLFRCLRARQYYYVNP
jgi:hypothetical protein